MASKIAFICPTPREHCTGGKIQMEGNADVKAHPSRKATRDCYIRYLLKSGYVRVQHNGFARPGEPVLILGKVSRFGEPVKYAKVKTRYVYCKGHGGHISSC